MACRHVRARMTREMMGACREAPNHHRNSLAYAWSRKRQETQRRSGHFDQNFTVEAIDFEST